MRKTLGLALLMAVPAMASGQDRAADRTAIQVQLDGWEEAWNRGDATAVASYYDMDADRTFAHGIPIRTRAAILRMYQGAFTAPLPDGVTRSLTIHDVGIRFITDDVAVVDYGFVATGIPILPHAKVDNQTTLVMAKRDGVWLRAAQRNWVPFAPKAECIQQCVFSGQPEPPGP